MRTRPFEIEFFEINYLLGNNSGTYIVEKSVKTFEKAETIKANRH